MPSHNRRSCYRSESGNQRMTLPQTLPPLVQLLRDIRRNDRARLYWGRPETIYVPVVRCRACGMPRPDDGTRCPTPMGTLLRKGCEVAYTCDAYQYAEVQARYDKWQAGAAEGTWN